VVLSDGAFADVWRSHASTWKQLGASLPELTIFRVLSFLTKYNVISSAQICLLDTTGGINYTILSIALFWRRVTVASIPKRIFNLV
jgi:hypothetical protein